MGDIEQWRRRRPVRGSETAEKFVGGGDDDHSEKRGRGGLEENGFSDSQPRAYARPHVLCNNKEGTFPCERLSAKMMLRCLRRSRSREMGFPTCAAALFGILFMIGIFVVRFPGSSLGVKVGSQAAVSSPAPPAEASKEAADDDDDLDLFGDETEEEKKVAEEREAAVKASSKKKESGKSSVLLDIKPWDDETDMKKLEEAVRSLEMPGLLWGASKLVPVGYGIKKLQIMMTIVDDLVSVDTLIEEELTVEPRNEYIQSCDIVAFNKI
ncbi:hypothetical protein BHM03_00039424 [Ensete ventricosum]|nr:hypothetical protein BHM03_00039424 [Ensete ventricosum]